MFALEILFQDGVSQPEMILVRRPQALVGASDYAHVVIEDMRQLDYQLRLVRDVGRAFRCKPVGASEGVRVPEMLEGNYDGFASVDTGTVTLLISSLDTDLTLREGEPPDRAGVRVLRQATSATSPDYPAVVVRGTDPMVISFVPDQPVYIGRSNQCAVRLDSSDISAKHARIGFESGEFWIEDLGSTNGTFVNGQQISGRVTVPPRTPIVLGRQITVLGVNSEEELREATKLESHAIQKPSSRRYPVLLSLSEVARPARLVLPIGGAVTVGRDPSSDMWLGAPHISRRHCEYSLGKTGQVSVRDFSTNGTAYDEGVLKKGQVLELDAEPKVFNFGGDITVALCFDESEEAAFRAALGASDVFGGKPLTNPMKASRSTMDMQQWNASQDINAEASVLGTASDLSDTIGGNGRLSRYRRLLRSLSPLAKVALGMAAIALVFIFVIIVLAVRIVFAEV